MSLNFISLQILEQQNFLKRPGSHVFYPWQTMILFLLNIYRDKKLITSQCRHEGAGCHKNVVKWVQGLMEWVYHKNRKPYLKTEILSNWIILLTGFEPHTYGWLKWMELKEVTEVQKVLEMGASLLNKSPLWIQVVQMMAEVVRVERYWKETWRSGIAIKKHNQKKKKKKDFRVSKVASLSDIRMISYFSVTYLS